MRTRVLVAGIGLSGLFTLGLTGCDTIRAVGAPDLPLWVHHPGGAISVEMRRTVVQHLMLSPDQYERGKHRLQRHGQSSPRGPSGREMM